jgi:lactoylglutathione lyase
MATYLHTCYRVLDIDRSVAFYRDGLGMEVVKSMPIRDEATNTFMRFPGEDEPWLELTLNFDRDTPYDIGDGYGHVALTVDNLDATLADLKAKGIEPERPPYTVRDGGSRLCFVRDPDGYRIELIGRS